MVVERGYTIVIGTLDLLVSRELCDDPVYLCRGGVSEYIEGTEAAISGLEWVLTYLPTIDIVIEVRLRADSLIHIGEVDGGDFRCPSLLCAGSADSSLG